MTFDASQKNMIEDTELGVLAAAAAKDVPLSERKTHKRKRSRYYEAEIHSSEADVESEDLPSYRLTDAKDMAGVIARKSLGVTDPMGGDNQSPFQRKGTGF